MKQIVIAFLCLVVVGCTDSILKNENKKKGNLEATVELEEIAIKKFKLDDDTAPDPKYIQVFKDSSGIEYFTFLNKYNNSIYFYDYNSLSYKKKIIYKKKGSNGIAEPFGYHIKTLDSIYVYDKNTTSLILTDGNAKIMSKFSLKGNLNEKDMNWVFKYPRYRLHTSMPILTTSKEIFITGQLIQSIPEEIISSFNFTGCLNFKTERVSFKHSYPKELYGAGYNWGGGMYTQVFPELHPDGDKIIYSFPISHDLYIADINSENHTKIYGGSNVAGTISSISKKSKKNSRKQIKKHMIEQDEYAGVLYDKYRQVYYRVLTKGAKYGRDLKDKPIAIIVMDKDFKYLGETVLGSWHEWNWKNIFVTQQGLNIEYRDYDDIEEAAMNIKIFALKKI